MNKEMEDWVLLEAAKRCGWEDWTLTVIRAQIPDDEAFRALCDMILKHEKQPVDRKLLCAQAALTGALIELDASRFPKKKCMWDCCVRAIELYESGFGK